MSKNKVKKKRSDSDEDDDVFYYRYSNVNPTQTLHNPNPKSNNNKGSLSSSFAPSKSTLYVSNINYSLTNSNLHTVFSTFGRIARITILKDRHTRLNRGMAFVQFVSRHDARDAAMQMDGKILKGLTLAASIVVDTDRCFECGEQGHLSYDCPRNQLSPCQRPEPKRPHRVSHHHRRNNDNDDGSDDDDGDGGGERFEDDNWTSVVDDGADERLLTGKRDDGDGLVAGKSKKKKKGGYFSDESDDDD